MATKDRPPTLLPLMTFQEFEKMEYELRLQHFYEEGGMIAHEELTSEPADVGETHH